MKGGSARSASIAETISGRNLPEHQVADAVDRGSKHVEYLVPAGVSVRY